MALTGRFNFRRSWFGKLMLKVEDEVEPVFWSERKPLKRHWRRATLIDLAQPGKCGPSSTSASSGNSWRGRLCGWSKSAPAGVSRAEELSMGGDGAQPHRGDAAAIEPLERVAVAWNS